MTDDSFAAVQTGIAELREGLNYLGFEMDTYTSRALLDIADKGIAFLNAWDKGQKYGGEIKELRAAISKLVGGRT